MPERKGKRSQEEVARELGITPKTLRVWVNDEGIDIDDMDTLRARASMKPKGGPITEELAEIKKRKECAQADLLEHKLEVERGKYVSHEEMAKDGMKAGMLIRSILQKMPGELTPRLAGKSSADVEKELMRWQRETLENISNYDTLMDLKNDRP